MSESKSSTAQAGKPRRWLRILVGLCGCLILLLVIAWFVLTSSAFLKGFILPRVSKAANARITVSDAVISPFSHVILDNLKVQTTGNEPLVSAREVRVSYSLMDILHGNINIQEIALVSPTINLVINPDGTSNLDPLLKSQSKTATKETKPAPSTKSSQPPHIHLVKLALTDATIRETRNYSNGQHDVMEVTNVNVTLTDVQNGGTGKLQLSAGVDIDRNPPAPAVSESLLAQVAGNFDFKLADNLMPLSVQGTTHLNVTQAGGAMQDLNAFGANFECELTPTNITQIALRFQKAGVQLGALQVSGPFDLEKTEGHLTVKLLALNRQVLNLLGASAGVEFNGTTINSTNEIELAKSGSLITAKGQLDIADLQLTRAGQTTPTLNANANYDVTVNRTAQTALLDMLTFSVTQNQQPRVKVGLTSPMNLSWGGSGNAVGDSTLNVNVTDLNLADWKPFLGGAVSGGDVNFSAKLRCQAGGKQLGFNIDSKITDLSANLGSNQLAPVGVTLQANGQVANFKQLKLDKYSLQLAQQNQPLLNVAGSGTAETDTQNADIQVQLQAMLPGLLKMLPMAGANLASGTVTWTGEISQNKQTQSVNGKLSLTQLTGQVGKNEFNNFGDDTDVKIAKNGDDIQINKITGELLDDGNAGGSYDISGNYDLKKKSGQVAAKLTDFNQNGLRPFLQPLLADKKLVSVAINSSTSAQIGPGSDAAVKMDLEVTNLVVNDPSGKFPATPLQTKLLLDASVKNQVADLNQFRIALTPTARATNQLDFTGKVDFSRTNAITGNLKLAANSLDLTPYYDLFAGQSKPGTTAPPPASSAPAANPNQEPAAVNLPLQNFTVNADINQLYLREVNVASFQMTTKIDGGHVVLNPCRFNLNGAPVSATADLNLGVPGYQYNVTFSAQNVPVAPLADSFAPAYSGKATGDLIADAQIKGAGVTGTKLQKNLTGNVSLILTNANIQLVGPTAKKIITPFAIVLGMNELLASPLNGLNAQVKIGDGKISLAPVIASSDAFQANVTGDISIATVLTNSTINNIPVNLSLAQNLASKLSLGASSGAAYVPLPNFATLGGTLGEPKSNIDKKVIAGLLAKSTIGIAGKLVGGTAGKTLNTVEGLLNGGTSTNTSTQTNQPSSTAPINQLLRFFKRK